MVFTMREKARAIGLAAGLAAALRAVVDAGVLPRVYGPLEVPVRFAIEPGP